MALRSRHLSDHKFNTQAAWSLHKGRCTKACTHERIPVICLHCEFGLCRQGCSAPLCECPNGYHKQIDYEAEKPR